MPRCALKPPSLLVPRNGSFSRMRSSLISSLVVASLLAVFVTLASASANTRRSQGLGAELSEEMPPNQTHGLGLGANHALSEKDGEDAEQNGTNVTASRSRRHHHHSSWSLNRPSYRPYRHRYSYVPYVNPPPCPPYAQFLRMLTLASGAIAGAGPERPATPRSLCCHSSSFSSPQSVDLHALGYPSVGNAEFKV